MSGPAVGGDGRGRPADVVPLDRLNAFSDGVFAIAITLLVLELTAPVGAELTKHLIEQWPEFLGYLMSFAFIGGSWLTHARMTRLMRRADGLAASINLLFLLSIAVLPFSTSLLVGNLSGPDVEVAVLIYGINVLVASLLLSFLMVRLVRERTLLIDEVADESLAAMARQRRVSNGVAVIGVACALVVPLVAVVFYVAVTVLGLVLPLVQLQRSRGNTTTTTS